MQALQSSSKKVELKQTSTVGTTHWVKPKGQSIYEGEQGKLLAHGTAVAFAKGPAYRSRRGPNQETFSTIDKANPHQYIWYPVHLMSDLKQTVYIREDALGSHAQSVAETTRTKAEQSQTEYEKKVAELKEYTPPPKLLKGESILSFTGAVLKFVAGIALSVFGLIPGLIGQFIGAIGNFIVGVFKWKRSNRMSEQKQCADSLIAHYRTLLGLNPDQARSKALPEKEAQKKASFIAKLTDDINAYRVVEAFAGLLTSVGGFITGNILAMVGVVPKLIKVGRSIAQAKKAFDPKSKWPGILIRIEAFLAGLVSLIGLEEAIRVASGGEKLPSDIEGGASAAVGTGIGAVKFVRGKNTSASASTKGREKELKAQKRLRKTQAGGLVTKAKSLKKEKALD